MLVIKKFFKDKIAVISSSIILIIVLIGIFAPYIAPHPYDEINITAKLSNPNSQFPLGTDQLGRCILSRLIYGIRITVNYSLLTMLITITVSSILGFMSGYFSFIDEIIMRIVDVFLSFPSEVLVLAIVGIKGPGLSNVVFATIIAKWAWYTRMIRSSVLHYKQKNYIKFAKISGISSFKIIKNHIFLDTIGEIIIFATLDTGWVILNISALSFLGLGVQPPAAEWGMMLKEAKTIMITHPFKMLAPGLSITIVVLAFNFLGDSIQDLFNPK